METVQVRLYLMVGEVRQVERYTVKNVKGHWLLDGQVMEEDRVIEKTI